MFLGSSPSLPKSTLTLFACVAVGGLIGCAGDPYGLGKTARVRGRVMVGDVPLKTGIVTFQPDTARGNTTPHQPTANIDRNGNYELFTVGKVGAPLGWYKVLVTAIEESDEEFAKRAASPGRTRLPKSVINLSVINLKYRDLKTTDLVIEVVESPAPGAYDLKLTQ